jgi:hypothetical protein
VAQFIGMGGALLRNPAKLMSHATYSYGSKSQFKDKTKDVGSNKARWPSAWWQAQHAAGAGSIPGGVHFVVPIIGGQLKK